MGPYANAIDGYVVLYVVIVRPAWESPPCFDDPMLGAVAVTLSITYVVGNRVPGRAVLFVDPVSDPVFFLQVQVVRYSSIGGQEA